MRLGVLSALLISLLIAGCIEGTGRVAGSDSLDADVAENDAKDIAAFAITATPAASQVPSPTPVAPTVFTSPTPSPVPEQSESATLPVPVQSINSKLLSLANEYASADISEKAALAKALEAAAAERAEKIANLFEQDPTAAMELFLSTEEYAALPPTAQEYVERPASLDGSIEVVYFDSAVPEESRYEYYLREGGKKFHLHFSSGAPTTSTGEVSVSGFTLGNEFLVQGSIYSGNSGPEGRSGSGGSGGLASVGEQKTAVILIRFIDSEGPAPFTREWARNEFFNGQVQKFYREASFNKMWFTGDVFGWYTVPITCADDAADVSSDLAIATADPDVYFPNYSRILVITDDFCRYGPNGHSTIGKVTLNSADGPFNASYAIIMNIRHFFDQVPLPSGGNHTFSWNSGWGLAIHELGHSLGVDHSNFWECGTQVNCNVPWYIAYGNRFDVMGRGWTWGQPPELSLPNAAFHFSGFLKNLFGWLDSTQYLQVNSSGIYSLKPLEGSSAVVAEVRNPAYPQFSPFFIEYRRPTGFDEGLNDPLARPNAGGLFVNRLPYLVLVGQNDQYLLDFSPTNPYYPDEDSYAVALQPYKTFDDPAHGIRLKNYGWPPKRVPFSEVRFQVSFYNASCVRNAPTIRPPQVGLWMDYVPEVYAGMQSDVFVVFENQDSELCPDSTFEYRADLPSGWSDEFNPPSPVSQSQGALWSPSYTISVPVDAHAGVYYINFTLKNRDTGLFGARSQKVLVKRGFCGEQDGGLNYYSSSSVQNATFSATDSCVDSTTLREYYCSFSGGEASIGSKTYACPYGCVSNYGTDACAPSQGPRTPLSLAFVRANTLEAQSTVPSQYRQFLSANVGAVNASTSDGSLVLSLSQLGGQGNVSTNELIFQRSAGAGKTFVFYRKPSANPSLRWAGAFNSVSGPSTLAWLQSPSNLDPISIQGFENRTSFKLGIECAPEQNYTAVPEARFFINYYGTFQSFGISVYPFYEDGGMIRLDPNYGQGWTSLHQNFFGTTKVKHCAASFMLGNRFQPDGLAIEVS